MCLTRGSEQHQLENRPDPSYLPALQFTTWFNFRFTLSSNHDDLPDLSNKQKGNDDHFSTNQANSLLVNK